MPPASKNLHILRTSRYTCSSMGDNTPLVDNQSVASVACSA